jgi:hypothetical protein
MIEMTTAMIVNPAMVIASPAMAVVIVQAKTMKAMVARVVTVAAALAMLAAEAEARISAVTVVAVRIPVIARA